MEIREITQKKERPKTLIQRMREMKVGVQLEIPRDIHPESTVRNTAYRLNREGEGRYSVIGLPGEPNCYVERLA